MEQEVVRLLHWGHEPRASGLGLNARYANEPKKKRKSQCAGAKRGLRQQASGVSSQWSKRWFRRSPFGRELPDVAAAG